MNVLAAIVAVGFAAAVPQPSPVVRLAPFQCAGLSHDDIRPLLRVELGERLLDETAPANADFVLVSIACEANTPNVLSIRQAAGPPARRRVSLEGVRPEARARNLAVAIAELLRREPQAEVSAVMEPPPPPAAAPDADSPGHHVRAPAHLELVEPLILMPLTTGRRTGVRTRLGHTDVPSGIETPNYYVFGIEPFLDLALGTGAVASLTLPVTWTEGPAVTSRGQLANLTAAIRYATGDRLRVGIGAALSLNVGQAPIAQAESNVFEIDRFRDATNSLRLQADGLWRADRLYLQAEAAVMLLADQRRLGTLLRSGIAGGIALSNATVGVEYVVLSDVFDDYFATNDRFVQALIVGTRLRLSTAATLGIHLQTALDQGPNLGVAGTVSTAWTF